MLEFGQVLAHSQEALYCRFVGWNWHVSDGGYFGRIGLHPFMGKLVPHESDRRGFELKLFSQRAVDRVQHTSPRAALSFGCGRCQRPPLCRHTHTRKCHRRCQLHRVYRLRINAVAASIPPDQK